MKLRGYVVAALIVAAAGGALFWALSPAAIPDQGEARAAGNGDLAESVAPAEAKPRVSRSLSPKTLADGPVGGSIAGASSEPSAGADEEQVAVDAFYDLTDRWIAPKADGVTMADIESFAHEFRKVPVPRRRECLQRALNLVPDENVMLLVGILMDKTQDVALVELVYNDVLNRDEDVKRPILQTIFKDKSHPCWANTAWILDVTGEIPSRK
jgi:hypothetical protein